MYGELRKQALQREVSLLRNMGRGAQADELERQVNALSKEPTYQEMEAALKTYAAGMAL